MTVAVRDALKVGPGAASIKRTAAPREDAPVACGEEAC